MKKWTKLCPRCNNLFANRSTKYCSKDCYNKSRYDLTVQKFNSGQLSHKAAKEHLIKLHGNKCMRCGWNKINPYSNSCPIDLEHIDGDSSNNNPDNLLLLCPNCHSLTPTYKSLNIGKGRFYRQQRYSENKSF